MAGRASRNSTADQKATSTATATSVPSRSAGGAREQQKAAKEQAPTAVQPVEPEDAYLTGTSRSLQRRLLGLNVEGSQGQSKPRPEANSAGLHSTGSSTGASGSGATGSPGKPSDRKKK